MKRSLCSVLVAGLAFGSLFAQNPVNLPSISVSTPDLGLIAEEDALSSKQGKPYRVSVGMDAPVDIVQEGLYEYDGKGNVVISFEINAVSAQGLNLQFTEFTIPENAELRLFNPDTKVLIGPYTAEHSSEDGSYHSSIIKGDRVVIEAIVPVHALGELKLKIEKVGFFYRNVSNFVAFSPKDLGDSDACEVNVNCSEGASWQDEKRGVARILSLVGGDNFLCSGSLINNTANDCTPYFLTAQHCGSDATAQEFRSWSFNFNYEAAGCSNPGSEPSFQTVTGSVKVSASGNIGDVQKSDFLLLILKSRPINTVNAYYNGWNRNNSVSGGGVGIHHPAGDIKKISTYTSTPFAATWDGTPGSHWGLTWVATANGDGVTEGGSSGSPLFNNAGLIIGDLSGGSSFCVGPSGQDFYGKFFYSWESCGTASSSRLKPWLDRNATGATTLTGINNTCTAATLPVVEFVASNVFPLVGTEVVTLTDQSTNSPFYWQWVITGPGTATFTGGTNTYSQNPQVTFSAAGQYSVTLYAANTAGYNHKVKPNYIHVGNVGIENEATTPVVMYPNPARDMVYVNLGEATWNIEKTTFTMIDMTGKFIMVQAMADMSGNLVSVRLPETVSNGIYLVKITDGVHTTSQRLEIFK